jgi:hypothetical protein
MYLLSSHIAYGAEKDYNSTPFLTDIRHRIFLAAIKN